MQSPTNLDKEQLMGSIPLFGPLDSEERRRLLAYMRLVRYPPKATLFCKGDPGTNMMAMVRGRAKVCTHSEDGKELVLNLINAGDVVGEIALLDGAARTADAVTLEDCEVLVLERRDFIPFLARHPETCLKLIKVLCDRVRRTSQMLEESLFLEGSARVAKRLEHLATLFGRRVPEGIEITIKLSQQQLGNMVGMSRESMNKLLGQWRRDKLVLTRNGHLVITDLERLKDI